MIQLASKNECMGCMACYNACPFNAIEIIEDQQGFAIPSINQNKCKECRNCERVCPPLNKYNGRVMTQKTFAAWDIEDSERARSNSGGVATKLAEYAIKNGYVVVGAIIDQDLVVRHRICETVEELDKLRMSKYVQSEVANVYKIIKQKLKESKKVIFFGTPCQVDAVKRVVGTKYQKLLITVDLICHGVPSPKYLREHLSSFEQNLFNVSTYAFRDNNKYSFQVYLKNGEKKVIEYPKDNYLYAFMKNVLDRESCHRCKYSSIYRVADITLGDFWGIKDLKTEGVTLEKEKGINAVLINTDKGYQVFKAISSELFVEQRQLEEVVEYNPFLREIEKSNEDRFLFRKRYSLEGFEHAVRWLRKRYIGHEAVIWIKNKWDRIMCRVNKVFR